MAFKHELNKTPIKGKNWTLSFGLNESTGGAQGGQVVKDYAGNDYVPNINFTCASAVMWNVNFTRNTDGYSCYGHMGESPVPIEERYELYAELVKRYKDNTYMVQLVGVVNGGTAARLKHYLQSENKHGYHTHDFANYLITQKVGVVVESPVFINTYHKWEGPSICQAWFWFSPSIIKECALVQHTGGIHGLENVKGWLHDSELNKKNVGGFDGLLAAKLVGADRFKKAADTWNEAMIKQGIITDKKVDKKESPPKSNRWMKTGN